MPVTSTGSRELSATLAAHEARIRNPAAFLAMEATALERVLSASWDSSASPEGERWAPRVTASRDVRTGRSRPRRDHRLGRMLERTGLLRASETVRVVGLSIIAGNDAPYARFVDRGTRFMRARRIMADGTERGPAGVWLAGFADRLARFVTSGSE